MSNNDYNLFWGETVRQLLAEGSLTKQECELWFDNMEFVNGNNNLIKLSVPSNFYRDQVTQRYLPLLQSKLEELSGNTLKIEFHIQSNNKETDKEIHKKTEPDRQIRGKNKNSSYQQLRKKYSFDNFVIGNNNSFAANAAQAISTNPGEAYNPLLIYGGVGLGKTHLMHAIGNAIHNSPSDRKIVYITAETFINEFIQSIRKQTQSDFKNKYRKVDVLLIDDVHDLQNKRETQEELFHTFNALHDTRKQMVFTCDRPPSDLKNFADRLRSRFKSGLNVDLQPPNFETRYAILRKKLEEITTSIPEEVLELIARNITSNVRELEGSLSQIVHYAELIGKKITLEIAIQQLKGYFSHLDNTTFKMDSVQRVVAEYFNITLADMKGKKRTKQINFPRQIAMYIIREISDFTTTEIGLEFGGRDHTTVTYSCQKIEDRMKSDSTLEPLINELIRSTKEQNQ